MSAIKGNSLSTAARGFSTEVNSVSNANVTITETPKLLLFIRLDSKNAEKNGKTLLKNPREMVIKYQNLQLRFSAFVCTGGALSRQECGLHKLFIKCLVLEGESRENGCYFTL